MLITSVNIQSSTNFILINLVSHGVDLGLYWVRKIQAILISVVCTTLSTSCEFGIQCEGFCWLCKKFVCSICTCMWPSLKISHSRVCFLCMLSMCGLLAYQYSTSLVSQVTLQGRHSNWDEDWLIGRGKTLLGIVIRIQRQFQVRSILYITFQVKHISIHHLEGNWESWNRRLFSYFKRPLFFLF